MAKRETELQILVDVPDALGLTDEQMAELARSFENRLVDVLKDRSHETEAVALAKVRTRVKTRKVYWRNELADDE
jgi:hypothetical protein